MDQVGVDVQSVAISDTNMIVVVYVNGIVEALTKDVTTYKKLYEKWLKDEPPFISDIFKVQMRDIILASINNDQDCINELDRFFTAENIEQVTAFINYMRKRDLTHAKAQWTVQQ